MKHIFNIIIILSTIVLITRPHLSMANESFEQINLYNDPLNKIDIAIIEEKQLIRKNTPDRKQELEGLLGIWILSYTIEEVTYTDRLEIDGVYEDEGEVSIWGELFLNDTGKGSFIICTHYIDLGRPDLVTYYATDYSCSSGAGEQFVLYALNFSGNTITNGYTGLGTTIEDSAAQLVSKTISVTGDRISVGSQIEANYNEESKLLDIPFVHYQGSNYHIILENKGDFMFSINTVERISQDINQFKVFVYYDDEQMALAIPIVNYQGSKFAVEFENNGDFIFTIKDVQLVN